MGLEGSGALAVGLARDGALAVGLEGWYPGPGFAPKSYVKVRNFGVQNSPAPDQYYYITLCQGQDKFTSRFTTRNF